MATPNKKATTFAGLDGQDHELEFKNVDIVRHAEGTILLPEGLSLHEAKWWIERRYRDEETKVDVTERLEGFPVDVANAMQVAAKKLYGETAMVASWWKTPQFLTVPIDHKGNTASVFIGDFMVPGMDGELSCQPDANDALVIYGSVKKKDMPIVKRLLDETKVQLKKFSLFRGKAWRIEMKYDQKFRRDTFADPEFIDVTKVPTQLLLNEATTELLDAAVWTPITDFELVKDCDVPFKRGALLEGPYGTGKTLSIYETAKLAQENNITLILLKDIKDLQKIYPLAVRYAPTVLCGEDADLLVTDADGLSVINNMLDGVEYKDKSILLLLSTNHIEKFPESLLRPGRFHTIISYSNPDEDTSARLVQQFAEGHIDHADFDTQQIGQALSGQMPAVIHEVVQLAKLFTIRRLVKQYGRKLKADDPLLQLKTADVLKAIRSMQKHIGLLAPRKKDETAPVSKLGYAIGTGLADKLNQGQAMFDQMIEVVARPNGH